MVNLERSPDKSNVCALGGRMEWRQGPVIPDKITVDTIWRSTTIMLRKEIIGGAADIFVLQVQPQSAGEGEIDADYRGFKSGDTHETSDPEVLYEYWHVVKTWEPFRGGRHGKLSHNGRTKRRSHRV